MKLKILAIFAVLSCIDAARILVVFSFPGKSHGILGDAYTRLLLEAGHQVTYVTPFPTKTPHPNLTLVDVSHNLDLSPADLINIKLILNKEIDPTDMTSFFDIMLNMGNMTFSNQNVKNLLMDPTKKFDVVIAEWLYSELSSGFHVVFDCPHIWFSTVEPHSMVMKLIDEPLNPSYNPDVTSGTIPPFTFIQRVQELWIQVSTSFFFNYFFVPMEEKLYNGIFGPVAAIRGKTLPSFDEARFNASLMLGNSHVSLGQATKLPQNYKPIAGYHIDPKLKPMPDDLKKIFDNEQNGVIYFSMGSNLKSKDMPEPLKRGLLKIFGELKQTVLWKFEEELSDLPKNVHIIKWAPQPTILAHPKTVLFITHGGLLSTTETVHYGVPIIGIPVFADQFNNVDRAVKKGFAKRVDLSYNLADDLKVAIDEMLGNPLYKTNVKLLSQIYHDRPVSPGKELVHWVEHVIKTNGARHLRSPALTVPWYQKFYFDLAALILVALYTILVLLKKIFCSKKCVTVTQKKKKN